MTKTTAPRRRSVLRAVIATAFVFGPAVAAAVGVRPDSIENRALAPAPSVSQGWDALDAVGPWATDHLAGRSSAVHAKAWLDYYALHEMPVPREQPVTTGPAQGSTAGGTSLPRTAQPQVVRGEDGYLYYGEDFVNACVQAGRFEHAVRSFLKFAEVIHSSGRKVVFVVAPNKSSVVTEHLPRAVPSGPCATPEIAEQIKILDRVRHPLWVGVRASLADAQATGQQPYWRMDTHWSPAGAAVMALAVAEHLDPDLAERITVEPVRTTRVGDLAAIIGLTSTESLNSAAVSTGGTVRPDPASDDYDPQELVFGPERWTTEPGTGLIQGRSLVLGDSFTYYALGSLRPLFANGTFLWTGHVEPDRIVSEIEASDTVVVQVVQRWVGDGYLYTQPAFRKKVAAALGVPAR